MAIFIDRCRNRDNEEVRTGHIGRIGRHLQTAVPETVAVQFTRSVNAISEFLHPAMIDIESNSVREAFRKRNGDRQPDVAETDDRDGPVLSGIHEW